jgi:hypothetical protein
MNIIGIEAFRSYLLAFFAVLGSVLASLDTFWRVLKNQVRFLQSKINVLQNVFNAYFSVTILQQN